MNARLVITSALFFAASFVLLVIAGEYLNALLGIEWLAVLLALLAVFAFWVTLAFIIGLVLPRKQLVVRTMTLNRKPGIVWQELLNFGGLPAAILASLGTVERLPDREGRPAWRFTFTSGWQSTCDASEAITDRRLVIQTPHVWLGRGWSEWDIEEHQGGSRVTAQVGQDIANPLYRFVRRSVSFASRLGLERGLEANLRALAAHFGELDTARIEPPPQN